MAPWAPWSSGADCPRPSTAASASSSTGDLKGDTDILPDPARSPVAPSTTSTSRPAPTSPRPTPSAPPPSSRPSTACKPSPARSTSPRRSPPSRAPRAWTQRAPEEAALRRRVHRAAQQDAVPLAERVRPGLPRRDLRRGARGLGQQVKALIEGGVDLLLVETIFDTLNAKAALFAIEDVFDAQGVAAARHDLRDHHRPERAHALRPDGRGVLDLRRARPPASRGRQLRAGRRARCARTSRSCRASPTCWSAATRTPACPTRSAATTRRPSTRAGARRGLRRRGLVNIVGGCCGTTPDHIRAIADAVRGCPPRKPPRVERSRASSGLEPLVIRPEIELHR